MIGMVSLGMFCISKFLKSFFVCVCVSLSLSRCMLTRLHNYYVVLVIQSRKDGRPLHIVCSRKYVLSRPLGAETIMYVVSTTANMLCRSSFSLTSLLRQRNIDGGP